MFRLRCLCFNLRFTRSGETSCVSDFVFQTSSSDEEADSPVLGASSSQDHAPVTPLQSESESDDGAKKKCRNYKRPRVKRTCEFEFQRGDDAVMDDDEMKAKELGPSWKLARFTS